MVRLSARIPNELAARLAAVADRTKRSKGSLVAEALTLYLDDVEDLEMGLARFRDPDAEWIDHEEVGRGLELG